MSLSSLPLRRPCSRRRRPRTSGRRNALLGSAVVLFTLLAWLPAGAQQDPSSSSFFQDSRPEGSWVATAYDTWGDGLVAARPGSTLTVSFLPAGRLEGRTGCGSYLGGHSVDGQAIRLGVLSSETGGCGRRLADEAFGFTQALSLVSRWVPSETGLELLDVEGRVRVRLERPGVVGPLGDWEVRRYARVDGSLATLERGLQAHLVLAGDGSATGSTGCQDYSGTYAVEADRIVIAPLTMIGLPCEGAAQRQDRRLRALLDDAVGWRRRADTLVLTDVAGEVLLELQGRPLPQSSASPSPSPPSAGVPGPSDRAPAPSGEPGDPAGPAGTAGTTTAPRTDLVIELELVASGFDAPLFVTGAGDGSGDRYVVEQAGRIWRVDAAGVVDPAPMLDIRERVLDHNERGLLGLAFHPDFAANGRFYVTYSQADDGATSISEFTLERPTAPPAPAAAPSPAASRAPRPVEDTERPLLLIPQIYTTHKGGMLAFDDQGMLLVSTGDGGSGNDPHGHGLDRWSLLGKLLRLDVDAGWPYVIPEDNGFAGEPDGRAEIHAIGLRNPWRFSVDRLTGDIYIGDVGQSAWEEIDVLPSGTRRASFGWSDMEGPRCLGDRACDPSAHIAPAIAYPHVSAERADCAVIGGYAYRGDAGTLPGGTYVYGDFCSGTFWAVPVEDLVAGAAEPVVAGRLDPAHGQLRSFGEDDRGELYAVTSAGEVLRIVAAGDPRAASG